MLGVTTKGPNWLRLIVPAAAVLLASSAGFALLDMEEAAFGALLAAAAVFIAAVDVDRFEIPDAACGLILALGLGWALESFGWDPQVLFEALIRVLVTAGALLAVRSAYRLVRHVEGLGLGDVKLLGAGASWLVWPNIAFALLIAAAAAVIVVVLRSLLMREKAQAATAIPFGAFLAPAIWIAWFAQVSGFSA